MKQLVLGSLAVFVVWSVLDFVIHSLILQGTYAETADLWRPMEEMKMGVMYISVLISAICFTTIYQWFVGEKSLMRGAKLGLLYGISVGVGMGYGLYSVMPIPYILALVWFLGTTVEGAAAGLVAAAIVKDEAEPEGMAA